MADDDLALTPALTRDPALQRILDGVPKPSERLLRCAKCNAAITTEEARIAVGGSHAHDFTNPFGIRFNVGCFDAAPGCAVLGPPQHADTWFPGHMWRLASCGECAGHLGWRFEPAVESAGGAGAAPFYGLILPRLRGSQ